MVRFSRSKLLVPSGAAYQDRPRLLAAIGEPHLLVLQAPAGAGKTALLAQWLETTNRACVYYRLDNTDQDGAILVTHLSAGFQKIWPDWQPPDTGAPHEFATELAGEAAARPPTVLVLDGLEAAFGQAWLADLLSILVRFAPPALTVALSTRAPLPVDVGPARVLKAADLAFTLEEAVAWLGGGDWPPCFDATGGLPLALEIWRHQGPAWPAELTTCIMAAAPPYIRSESNCGLVSEWLSGTLPLEAFAHQVSVGQPGAEQRPEIGDLHFLLCDDPVAAKERLDALWKDACGLGNRLLMGAVAMLEGEAAFIFGEHALAMEWYRQAFSADPKLELMGSHSLVLVLRDLDQMEEAEAVARRCLDARRGSGDLSALCMAYLQLGNVCSELGKRDEAEEYLLEAQRISRKLAGNPAIALSAICYRAIVEAGRGNAANFRKYAEEAFGLAEGRFRCLQAFAGQVLAAALSAWGDCNTCTDRVIRLPRWYRCQVARACHPRAVCQGFLGRRARPASKSPFRPGPESRSKRWLPAPPGIATGRCHNPPG